MIPDFLLDEIEEYLDDHQDVIDGQDGPRPNKAMVLLGELRRHREKNNRQGFPLHPQPRNRHS